MDIFERDKLPVVATVEQVCFPSNTVAPTCLLTPTHLLELFDGVDGGRQNAKNTGRRDGSAIG